MIGLGLVLGSALGLGLGLELALYNGETNDNYESLIRTYGKYHHYALPNGS